MTDKVFPIDPLSPDPGIIYKAGKIIQNNGIVIFPAKCLYGVAANASDETAVESVFQLKHRPMNNPILVLIPDKAMVSDLATHVPKTALKLMDAFWPGNLTLVFEAQSHISKRLTAGTGKIGIRLPVHPVARALIKSVGVPITGTSANLSGQKSCHNINQLDSSIIDSADLVLDAGILKGGTGSSIADVTTPDLTLLRQGEVTIEQIKKVLSN